MGPTHARHDISFVVYFQRFDELAMGVEYAIKLSRCGVAPRAIVQCHLPRVDLSAELIHGAVREKAAIRGASVFLDASGGRVIAAVLAPRTRKNGLCAAMPTQFSPNMIIPRGS